MVKRFLVVEVEVGGEEGSDPSQSIPTVNDWGAYKRFMQSILRANSDGDPASLRVHSVYELTPTGVILHSVSLGPVRLQIHVD